MKNNLFKKGINLSYCQRNVNYKALKEQGVEFAMIRTGCGQKIDDMLYKHLDGCIAAGIKCGAYVYALAKNEDEARLEARYALKSIENYKLEYPIFYNLEDNKLLSSGISKAQRTLNVLIFLEEILRAVYYPGIFVNPAWLENYLEKEWLWGFDIWLSSWTGNPEIPTKYNYEQKTWHWGLDNLNGAGMVAGNICYADYPGIIKAGGFNKIDCYRETSNIIIDSGNSDYAVFKSCESDYTCTGNAVKLRKYPSESAMVLKILEKNNIYRAISTVYVDGENEARWLYLKDEGGFSLLFNQLDEKLFEIKEN